MSGPSVRKRAVEYLVPRLVLVLYFGAILGMVFGGLLAGGFLGQWLNTNLLASITEDSLGPTVLVYLGSMVGTTGLIAVVLLRLFGSDKRGQEWGGKHGSSDVSVILRRDK